jgi:hypothetical protein
MTGGAGVDRFVLALFDLGVGDAQMSYAGIWVTP